MYEYVKRSYGVNPEVGQRVRHTGINKWGTVARENRSQSHYVMVHFDSQRHASPCHPEALQYYEGEGRSVPPHGSGP